ncbi:MAG: CmcJ/NvfI family oxidoreductase, partial [Reyranellaceae bacterium]
PLALADARSIKPKDLIASDLIYRERTGETYAVAHNRDQRWFWFPRMERDEVVLIKCYDSAPGHAKISAHTAFDDPTAPANPRPRESIEIRTIAFWD